jgi:hypothetical protein
VPLSYDDDNLPAIEPGAAAPAKRGKLVFDAAPAAPAAAPEPSILDKIDQFSQRYNPLDPRRGTAPVIPNPLEGALERGGEGIEKLGGKIYAGLHGLTHLGSGDAADVVNADRAALTPTPSQSPSAQQFDTLASTVAKPFQAASAPIDKLVENAGPGIRTAVPAASEAIQDITSILPVGAAANRAAKVADAGAVGIEGAAKPSTATPLETARGAGYQAPPSVVQASNPAENIPGTAREAIVGPTGVRGDANVANQVVTTKLAGKEIGVPNATKISAEDAAKFRAAGPGPKYDTVAEKLGYMAPDSAAADELNALVADQNPASALPPKARTNVDRIVNKINDGGYTGKDWIKDVSWLRENGARDAANALEDMAQRHLTAAGDTETLALHRGARQDFAKSYDIQNAIGRGGQIDAQQLRALDDKYPGLLTGNLKVIATAARELPEVTRLPGADTGPGVHTKMQAVHNFIGGAVKRLPGMNPMSESFQNAKFGREMSPTEQSYVPSFGRRDQAPLTERPSDPTGGLTLAPDSGVGGTATPRGEGIPLADVLSTGVEKPAPLGLSLSPMGAPAPQGVPFRVDPGHMAGDLALADEPPRRLGESLSDVAGVRSQGVPEGGMTRTAPKAVTPRSDTVDLEPQESLGMALSPGRAYQAGQREMFGKDRGAVKKTKAKPRGDK